MMQRKNIILLAVIGALITVILGGLFVLFNSNAAKKTDKLTEIPLFTPTSTPTTTPSPKSETGKFIILPNNYKLLPEDIEAIKTQGVKTIILDNPTADYTSAVSNLVDGLVIRSADQNLQYVFCDSLGLAVTDPSASTERNHPTSIGFSDCTENNKISNIIFQSCEIKTSGCQNNYLISLNGDAYYYNTMQPLLALTAAPEVSINNPLGTVILDWSRDNLLDFKQKSYSVEILNISGKRIFASGKISAQNKGDYFSPTISLSDQQLTVRLRIWYQYKGINFKSPLVINTSYLYAKAPVEVSTSKIEIKQMSWIPDWGMADGIDSVKANPKKWDTLSPVWFTPNKNGTLNKEPTINKSTLVSLIRSNNIRFIPTISTFDADILKEILNKHLDTHVTEIVNAVMKNNYDGIDLDYESTYENDKTLLLEFITKLATQLHAQGKTLSFTALPKIDDRDIYAFLPQTHRAQDWKAIGAIVDEFRIMAYDFTSQGSLQPGPLSPYDWNETLIRYAITQMPADKVVLALPLYAHGWPKPKSSNLAGSNNDKSLLSGELKNTISPQHDNIAYIKSHSAYYRSKYDPVVKEVRAEFKYNGVERVMYYLDKTSVDRRIELAQKYGIKGICYWRIGGERL